MASIKEQFLDDFDSSEDELPNTSEEPAANGATAGVSEDIKTEEAFENASLQRNLDDVLPLVTAYEKEPASRIEVSTNSARGNTSDEYAFVVRCVHLIPEIDAEIFARFQRLLSVYGPRFPELETIILNPLDYARVVIRAGNAADFSKIDLGPILPAGTVITVQVTASATAGSVLKPADAARASVLAGSLLGLDERKRVLLAYVERRASLMAPNLTVILGGAVAAALLGIVGGLKELACMPSCNVKVVGKSRQILSGASTQTARPHEGIVFRCPLVMSLPPALRSKGGDVVVGKATLAARVDANGAQPDGSAGRAFRAQLEKKFDKWQEPPPAKTLKPLAIPGGDAKKRHRAGKRARKEKERLGITDMRRLANRVKFGQAEEVYGNDLENEGFGMLGGDGSKRLRVQAKKTDVLSVGVARKIAKTRRKEKRNPGSAASGFATSLAFGEGRGIELGAMTSAPGGVGLGVDAEDGAKSSYFSAETPFLGGKTKAKEGERKSK